MNEVDKTFLDFLSVVYESENEHRYHMYQKKKNAKELGKSVDELPNKKYSSKKSEEEKRKADLKYAYKEGQYMNNSRKKVTNIGEINTILNGNKLHNIDDKQIRLYMNDATFEECEKLLRKLRYFSDNAGNGNDPNAEKKYEIAHRIFAKKFGIKDDSSVNISFIDKEDYTQSENIKKAAIEAGISLGATAGSVVLKKKLKKKVESLNKEINNYDKVLSGKLLDAEKRNKIETEKKKKEKELKACEKLAKAANIPIAISAAATAHGSAKLISSGLKRMDDDGNTIIDKAANKVRDARDKKYKEKYSMAMKSEKDKLATGKKGDTMMAMSEWGAGKPLTTKTKSEKKNADSDLKPGMSLYHVSPVSGIDALRASAHSENYSGKRRTKEDLARIETYKEELKDIRDKYNNAKKNHNESLMKQYQRMMNEINEKLTQVEDFSGQYHNKRRVYVTAGKSAGDAVRKTMHGVGRNVYRVKDMPDNIRIDPEANRSSRTDTFFSSRRGKLRDMSGVPMYIEVEGNKSIPVEQVDKLPHGKVVSTLSGHKPQYLIFDKKVNNPKKK